MMLTNIALGLSLACSLLALVRSSNINRRLQQVERHVAVVQGGR
jgi:hypothetical protein